MDASDLLITVYRKDFTRMGWIGNPLSVRAVARHNQVGTAEITVDAGHHQVQNLMLPGARCVITIGDEHLVGGVVENRTGRGPSTQATFTFHVQDDFRLLTDMLGWPTPTVANPNVAGAIGGQNVVEYDVKSGPAETVVKWFVSRNAARLGLPVTVAADQGRGANIRCELRMHPLTERLYPLVDQAGIGVTVRQGPSGLVMDCYTPTVRANPLTEESGLVVDWEWQHTPPAATRVVVAGGGEGTARMFRLAKNATLETEWGYVREDFRDARDTTDPVVMDARALETLTEAAPLWGLKLTLSDVGAGEYGRAFRVGDTVTHQIAPGAAVTDVVREAEINLTANEGLRVTPVVGDRSSPDRTTARAISAIQRALRGLLAGR